MADPRQQSFEAVLAKAGHQFADSAGLATGRPLEATVGIPTMKQGAFLTLIGESISVQVAILADREGIVAISRALLCMEPDEEELDEDDVADAVCEAVNQFGGLVKRSLISENPGLRLGLPLMVQGTLIAPQGVTATTLHVRWGGDDVWLVLMTTEFVVGGGQAQVA